jgi:hypothetical protein
LFRSLLAYQRDDGSFLPYDNQPMHPRRVLDRQL